MSLSVVSSCGKNRYSVGASSGRVQRRELVQFLPHSTTGFIYGSDLQDYSRRIALLDAMSTSVPALRVLPFERMAEITIITGPEEWLKRFRARTHDEDDARKRIKEGIQSLSWSLEQAEAMSWVSNNQGQLAQACNEIVGLVNGTRERNPANRAGGEALLRAIRIIDRM